MPISLPGSFIYFLQKQNKTKKIDSIQITLIYYYHNLT